MAEPLSSTLVTVAAVTYTTAVAAAVGRQHGESLANALNTGVNQGWERDRNAGGITSSRNNNPQANPA
jgi:hypothetical protein